MSLEKMGLGGVLIMDVNQAVQAMGSAGQASQMLAQAQQQIPGAAEKAGSAVDTLGRKAAESAKQTEGAAAQISGAVSKFGAVSTSLGIALAPLAAGFAFGLKQAADFEKQMSAVGAVSLASKEDMTQLELKAKELGVVTTFSATQAGEAMENLARAGASTKEIMSGIPGVLAAAAADSISLATSADIVAKVVRGLGLEFSEANRVADVLALTSAKTNTDMTSLGESFKYAAAQSRVMKIDLETTSAMLGIVADAGLRGSIGGTSFAAMLKKLAKPSEAANAWLKANRIEWTKTADGGLDIISVVKQIHLQMEKETDVMKKAAIAAELFGDRGQKAFSAIEGGLDNIDKSNGMNKVDTLFGQLQNAQGTAAEMAKKRLDNLHGAMVLFMSSVEVFAIETAGAFLKPMAGSVTKITDEINKVILVLQRLNAGQTDTEALNKEFGASYVAVAAGIKEGLATVIGVIQEVKKTILDVVREMTGNTQPNLIKMIAKMVTIMIVVGAMAAPVLLALGGIAAFITSVVIPVVSSIGEVVGGVAASLTGWGAVAVLAFVLFRKQGESVGHTFGRIWNGIMDLVNFVLDNAIRPFAEAFTLVVIPYANAAWTHIQSFFYSIREDVAQVVGGIVVAFRFLAPFFQGLFTRLGTITGVFLTGAILGFRMLLNAIGPVLSVLKDITLWLIEGVVNHILVLVKAMVALSDAVGKPEWVPQGMREFAKQGKFSLQGAVASTEFNAIGQPTVAKDKKRAGDVADAAATKEADKTKPGAVNVDVKLEDKRKIDVNACTKIDGREVALAQGRAQQEIHERNGFKTTPWQRRAIAEQGATPVGGLGSN